MLEEANVNLEGEFEMVFLVHKRKELLENSHTNPNLFLTYLGCKMKDEFTGTAKRKIRVSIPLFDYIIVPQVDVFDQISQMVKIFAGHDQLPLRFG